MARITLTSGFKRISEGEHAFYIYDCKYEESFGQLDLYLFSESTGETHLEKFFFTKTNGEANEGALNAFSYLAKVALNDFECEEIDPVDLIGARFIGTIAYQDVNGKTYAHIGEKSVYDDRPRPFDWEGSEFGKNWMAKHKKAEEVPAETPAPAAPAENPGSVDDMLAALGL